MVMRSTISTLSPIRRIRTVLAYARRAIAGFWVTSNRLKPRGQSAFNINTALVVKSRS